MDGDSFLSIINTVIANEVSDLELQRVSIEGQGQALRKLEQDELRARVKLSMYASVTSVIPFMDDTCKTRGYIVGRCNKAVEKFAFDHAKSTTFDTCNNVWKMMSM